MKIRKYIFVAIIIIIIVGLGWAITRKQPAPPENPNDVAARVENERAQAERQAIVTAILNQQQVLASKDVAKIKEYFTKIYVTAEDKKELSKMSNQELLKQAAAMTSTGPVTAEQLTANTAIWNISTDLAVVRIVKQNKPVVYTVQKVGETWY